MQILVEMICNLLSGEHPTLPQAEVKAILESEKIPFKIVRERNQLLRIEAADETVKLINRRAAFTHLSFLELAQCPSLEKEIFNCIKKLEIGKYLNTEESIAVRVKHLGRISKIDIQKLERRIGEIFLKKYELHVDLRKPNRLLIGIIANGEFTFGLTVGNFEKKRFGGRAPRKKPFFHPSSLQPKLARCLVNLSRVSEGKILFDPFCGTGAILIEAGLMGIESIGGELKEKMIKGAKRNLEYYQVANANLILSDALCSPIFNFDTIATDPPYGMTASTGGIAMQSLVERFVKVASDVLPENGFLCISSPESNRTAELAEKYGFKVIETHYLYVHRSLTREIAVLKLGDERCI